MSDKSLQRLYDGLRDADRGRTPPFAVMRARAAARAKVEAPPRYAVRSWRLAGLAAAAVAIALSAAVWSWHFRALKDHAELARLSSAKQVEQLVAAIDAHLTEHMTLSDWESPTDFLLAENTSNPKGRNTP